MSSNDIPIEPSFVETVEDKTKEINGLIVDSDSHIDWAFNLPVLLEPMALKCSNCKTITIHAGNEITATNLTDRSEKTKRILLCTNCGQISTK